MKILADHHNGSLYESHRLLFEKRLGWELYRPIGLDWFTEGYWEIAKPYGNNSDTVNQFLSPENIGEYDAYKALNGQNYRQDGVFYCYDGFHDSWHKAITLEKFKTMQFDVILASIPEHEPVYRRLRDAFQPQAKLIAQMGNVGQTPTGEIPNILDSTDTYQGDLHTVSYHQEFDTSLEPDTKLSRGVVSLMHLLPASPGLEFWNQLQVFKEAFGMGTDNGPVLSFRDLVTQIRTSKYVFHAKKQGDGYGHVFHNAYAYGRPVITFGSSYVGRQGGKLFEDGVTGLDLETGDINEKIKNTDWEQMSLNARKRFNDIVRFDDEEKEIRKFLENLQ